MQLPRWRGFNLLDKYRHDQPHGAFKESDFDLLAGWGFDFVRLPMSYRCWSSQEKPREVDERAMAEIDQAVEFGRARGIHVNLNLHRAPGYCVNHPPEPRDLWTDASAQADFAWLWGYFARRYRGVPSSAVSFDLLNEPPDISPATYGNVVRRAVAAIRAEDPERLIIADGLKWGRAAVPELIDLGVAQSTRGYEPMEISHYKASWIKGSDAWPKPTWPMAKWDTAALAEHYRPWQDLATAGVGVHVGEFGAFLHTPHDVTLAWMAELLAIWKANGWGWALWNLHGGFGILDTQREDVTYETLGKHQLDRKMLELLKAN